FGWVCRGTISVNQATTPSERRQVLTRVFTLTRKRSTLSARKFTPASTHSEGLTIQGGGDRCRSGTKVGYAPYFPIIEESFVSARTFVSLMSCGEPFGKWTKPVIR